MKAVEFDIKAKKIIVFKENTPVELLEKYVHINMAINELDAFFDKYFVKEYIEEGDCYDTGTIIIR
ncbi:MAG: hypothetical protein FWC39_01430 [Bacteroidetes bacterium]|nr:hypothetical protein [Bacteroidota bacterium]